MLPTIAVLPLTALSICSQTSAQTGPAPISGSTSLAASKQRRDSASPTIPSLLDANSEVLQLAVQDQWDRGNDMFGGRQLPPPDMHGGTVASRDQERQVALRKLLAEGKVKSGYDFWLSALIFQHSAKPEGMLFAHVLAASAAAKGESNGKWLAAATLDRYLWDIYQPQVFGTQFKKDSQGKWGMEPYERGTLTDAERALWCVVSLSEQAKILKDFQDGEPLASTGVKDCK